MQELLKKIIASFKKAIFMEMEAMRRRLGPFEVALTKGKMKEGIENEKWHYYKFSIVSPNDKLAVQSECSLANAKSETLVTITELSSDEVTVRSDKQIDLNSPPYSLVIYPWFLYEKLNSALESLLDGENMFVDSALRLFGKKPYEVKPINPVNELPKLNESQFRAVQLCSDSNLAFVWGPPGTGKTTTLGYIVTELLNQGQRVLITSTTNAAVDQALAALAKQDRAQPYFEKGQVLRIGQTTAETFGTSINQVVKRLNASLQNEIDNLLKRRREIQSNMKKCEKIIEKVKADEKPMQIDLFKPEEEGSMVINDFDPVFSAKFAKRILKLPVKERSELVENRQLRLQKMNELSLVKIKKLQQELLNNEIDIVRNSQIVLATMTNVYMSALLHEERFDTVIIEEAGMAILPSVFFCATVAEKKVIMVGDPKQLPPIVQSKDDYVYRAMGRNIFEVSTANSDTGKITVMLNIQYRMHPVIGDLVSSLFYEGKLLNSEQLSERKTIADKSPYPEQSLVVIDTKNQSVCQKMEGDFSRYNETNARISVDLAVEAVSSGIDSVAIITPYVAQSRLIREMLSEFSLEKEHIKCRTVHRFQGGESDMVIMDLVDAQPMPPGILLTDYSPNSNSRNLINVSISRARGKLVIIADVDYFEEKSPFSIINVVLSEAIRRGNHINYSP